jgi:hypothetical protein
MRAAGEALFPKNDLGAPDYETTELGLRTEAYVALLPPPQQRLIWLLFIVLELIAPALTFRLGRYSRLPQSAREEVVRTFRRSRFYPLRLIGDAVKAVLTMMYMSHPSVTRYMGDSR